jgi:hypothetical protein
MNECVNEESWSVGVWQVAAPLGSVSTVDTHTQY